MIPRLILVIVVAIVFYYALPLSFKKLTMRRRAKDVGRLLSLTDSKPVKGTLVSLNENIMTAAPAGSGEEIRVVPNRTRFYLREENGVIEQLNWDSVFLAQKGLSILWLPAKNRLGKNLCLISPPGEGSGKQEEDAKFAEMRDDETAKKWFVAAGAFLEFLFLVEASRFSAYKDVGIAALIAVFGKALPYCPPGLILTITAHYLKARNENPDIKKSRLQQKTGFALALLGIILNWGILFVLIREIGFL